VWIVVDYPPRNASSLGADEEERHRPVFLLAPTSTKKRIDEVARKKSGQRLSLLRVAARRDWSGEHRPLRCCKPHPAIRKATKLPIGVGFGIRDAESARRVAQDRGCGRHRSRIIQEIEAGAADQAVSRVKAFLKPISRGHSTHSLAAEAAAAENPAHRGGARKTVPEGLWTKCAACDAVLYSTDL